MKKYLMISLVLFGLMFLPSFALASNYMEPQWVDFCPSKFANIDVSANYITPERNYWKERRIVFNRRVQDCKASETMSETKACYSEIRKIEKDATKIYLEGKRTEQSRIRMYMKL